MKKSFLKIAGLVILGSLIIVGCGTQTTPTTPAPAPTSNANITDDLKKAIDEVKGALPKFAIPMREVGDRFDNMYYAAKGGNWALAAYMSKYMNSAMNAAKVTKPTEYPLWESFNKTTFEPVNKAIQAKDFNTFDKAYTGMIDSCNACHKSMGYSFVKIITLPNPADQHMDYSLKSEPSDVPK
ncbi:MAG: hypothetical protein WA131_11130 [Desulfitobacteriaceae bacterium]